MGTSISLIVSRSVDIFSRQEAQNNKSNFHLFSDTALFMSSAHVVVVATDYPLR